MKLSILILATFCVIFSYAQESEFSKGDKRLIREAEAFLSDGDYAVAMDLYDSLLLSYPLNSSFNYGAGFSRFHLRVQRSQAMPFLKKSSEANFGKAHLPLAILFHEQGLLYDAGQELQRAARLNDPAQQAEILHRQIQLKNAQQAIFAEQAVAVVRMDEMINSQFVDHTPFVTLDDSMLIFTSRRPINVGAVKGPTGEYDENIYVSYREGESWSPAAPLSGDVNGLLHDAIAGLSPDLGSIVIFRTARNIISSELWMAEHQQDSSWKVKDRLPSPINSKYIEAGIAISWDGTVLIISSDRPGGYGGKDLYRVVRFGNGNYSEPVNLGPEVNSEFDELSPSFLPDGKTLFFSSNRNESIGGYDLFQTTWDGEFWGQPENLGYPLNSFRDDLHLSVSPRGGVCYFSRNEALQPADYSIYRSNLPGFNMEANIIKGSIRDSETGALVKDVDLTMFSDETGDIMGIYPCREGRFFIVLLPGESGLLEATKSGYDFFETPLKYECHEGIWEINLPIEMMEE